MTRPITACFTHCALHVRDLDESITFYRSYCGLDVVRERGQGEGRTVWLASPGAETIFVLVLLGGGVVTLSEIGPVWTINQQAKSLKSLASTLAVVGKFRSV
jgi:catechol 2,3-dioxygenase-like lactoylglutathione lyase family enzyme